MGKGGGNGEKLKNEEKMEKNLGKLGVKMGFLKKSGTFWGENRGKIFLGEKNRIFV